jgi:hypothetical protein
MLTVIVIMGIIMGIGIPAVTNLMKSGGLSSATRQVHNALTLARQCAITQRVYARVVFAFGTPSTLNPQDMLYRTYAVMYKNAGVWQYISKWEYLPVGAVFLKTVPGGGLGALDDNTSSLLQQGSLPFPIPGYPANVGTLAYIEFTPTGAATPFSASVGSSTLAITEGFMPSSGTPTPTSKTTAGLLVNVATLTVDNIVGHIKVTRP